MFQRGVAGMRRLAWSWSRSTWAAVAAAVLTVLLAQPQVGRAATPIFTSSFENTGFSEWTTRIVQSPGSLVDSESTIVNHGLFSGRSVTTATTSKAAAFKNLGSSHTILALRMDIMIVSANLPAYGYRQFAHLYEGEGWRSTVSFGIKRFTDNKLHMAVWDLGPSNYLADEFIPGQWYTVEVFATQGAGSTGTLEFWVDGVQKLSLTGRNTGSVPWGKIAVGNYSGSSGDLDLVMDNVIVDDEFIPFGSTSDPGPTPTPSNPPTAVDDSYITDEDVPLVVAAPGVLGNDNDPDGDSLTAVRVSGPSHGVLVLNANGSFTYSPNANYSGPDSFTYKASDGTSGSNTATVNITVNPVADAPVAVDDSYSVEQDSALNVAAPGVLGNDSDADGGVLNAVLVSGPLNGTLTLNGDGSFSYMPNPGYNGPDLFTYKASDGLLESLPATVNISVTVPGAIFTSSFENTGLDEWDFTIVDPPGSFVDTESVLVHHGQFAGRSITGSGTKRSSVFKHLDTGYTTLALRMDIQVVSSQLPEYGHRDFAQFYQGTTWKSTVKFGVKRFKDNLLHVAVWDNGPYSGSNYLGDVWEPGRWYTVEIMATQHGDGTGTLEFWIDGVKKYSRTDANVGNIPWAKFQVGNYSGETGAIDLVLDNVILDDQFIPFN